MACPQLSSPEQQQVTARLIIHLMHHHPLRCTTCNPSGSYEPPPSKLDIHSWNSSTTISHNLFFSNYFVSLLHSRVMSSKQATSPFASVVDGDDAMSQEHLSWEKEESAEAHGTPQLPLHSLLHGKAPDEMQPLSSVPSESDWDSLVSAQQRMVRHSYAVAKQTSNRAHAG